MLNLLRILHSKKIYYFFFLHTSPFNMSEEIPYIKPESNTSGIDTSKFPLLLKVQKTLYTYMINFFLK